MEEAQIEVGVVETQDAVAQALIANGAPSIQVSMRPAARPKTLVLAPTPKQVPQQEIVTRASTSGGQLWGVHVGQYPSRYKAEKVLLQTALTEMATLDGSLRKVIKRPRGFDANFLGLNRDTAELACQRLQARNIECQMIGPS